MCGVEDHYGLLVNYHVEVLESLLDSDGHSNTGSLSIKEACL